MENTQNPKIDRIDIAYELAERTPYPPVMTLGVLMSLGNVIADALISHGRAEIKDFGTFRLELRAPRSGTLNGARWSTPERMEIVFEAWPSMAEIVATRSGIPTY